MGKKIPYDEQVDLLEAEIKDIDMAMKGNPLSKRWQLLQIELSIKTSTLTTLRSKHYNSAPSNREGSKFLNKG